MKSIMLCSALVVVTGCSHRMKCFSSPEHAAVARCPAGPIIDVPDLEERGTALVGSMVTVAGPLRTGTTWCDDCCPSVGSQLSLGDSSGAQLGLGSLWCRRSSAGPQQTCPLSPDGRRIVVRGILDRASHAGAGGWYLRDTEVCE